MRILVKLFANFRQDRFKAQEYQVAERLTCAEMVALVGIAEAKIGVVMVNGRHAQLNHPLQEGDTLALFPLVGGG